MMVTLKEGECGVGEGLGENIRQGRPELEERKWMQRESSVPDILGVEKTGGAMG